jgi:ubiquitin-like 1-activating enzyme E1 B
MILLISLLLLRTFAQPRMVSQARPGGKLKVVTSRNWSHLPLLIVLSPEMAGNIIPAIATTNAIISGLIVLQALHLLRKSHDKLKNVFIQFKPQLPLSTVSVSLPNPACSVCRDTYAELRCDPARVTLGEVISGVLGQGDGEGTGPRDVSVYEDKRVLSDPDWDDNHERTLESLGVTQGKFLTIVDEDDELATLALAISPLS